MSIRWKFVAVCILIAFVPLFFLNKYSIDFFDRFTRTALERHMIDHAYVIGNEYASQRERADFDLAAFRSRLARYGEKLQTRIRIISTNGVVIADSGDSSAAGEDLSQLKEILKARAGDYGARNQLTPDRQYMYYYIALPIARDGQPVAIAHLSRHTGHIIGAINRMVASHRLAYAVAIPVATLIAVLTALTLVHPLRRLTRAARRFAAGQQSFECRVRGRDEIAQLQRAISSMASEIERKNSYNRDFLATAAHELKTPLAAIRAAAEVLEDGAFENPEARERFIANILFETRRLDQLVGELRELTRIDAESVRANSRMCEYNACVSGILDRIRPTLPENCAAIELHPCSQKLRVRIVPEQIEQVLTNLIENSTRYTPSDGRIEIVCEGCADGYVRTTVSDTGAGIKAEHIGQVFDRFFTTEAERAVNAHGAGLGLAIAKSIIVNHGGEIHVESTPGQGSKFIFTLPLHSSRSRNDIQ